MIDTGVTPVYIEIRDKAVRLRELGMSDKAIARALAISDKTVSKAISSSLGPQRET
jgi:DNA-binding NarL/FixJ family response regulator